MVPGARYAALGFLQTSWRIAVERVKNMPQSYGCYPGRK